MDVIVLAGGAVRESDPLYQFSKGLPKSLIQLDERRIIEHVVQGLRSSRAVERIVILGITDAVLHIAGDDVEQLEDFGGIVSNVREGLRHVARTRGPGYALVVAGDLPCVSGEDVNEFCRQCAPYEAMAYYPFMSRATMETAYPGAQRTYARLRDGDMTGGNCAIVHTDLANSNEELWEKLVQARKSPWQTARLIGLMTIARLALRRISSAEIGEIAGNLFGMPIRCVTSEHASLGMDVDKPHHLVVARERCANRAASVSVEQE